jgi:hypothetical protein
MRAMSCHKHRYLPDFPGNPQTELLPVPVCTILGKHLAWRNPACTALAPGWPAWRGRCMHLHTWPGVYRVPRQAAWSRARASSAPQPTPARGTGSSVPLTTTQGASMPVPGPTTVVVTAPGDNSAGALLARTRPTRWGTGDQFGTRERFRVGLRAAAAEQVQVLTRPPALQNVDGLLARASG